MIHDPEILILDEPVSGLDPNQIIEIRELIKRIGKEKIVIMSSHILQEIQATVDRIIIINEGTIVADGSPDKLLSSGEGASKLELEIGGPTIKDVRMIEKSISGLSISDISRSKGTVKALIEYDNKTDLRSDVFKYIVESGWGLLKMNPVSENLEGIFRELTSSNHE